MQTEGIKGGRTYNPIVYSEKGVAMLTSCLHTRRAIEASIQIIEAFGIEAGGYKEARARLCTIERDVVTVKPYALKRWSISSKSLITLKRSASPVSDSRTSRRLS